MPPFISRDDTQVINAGNSLNKNKRRSFRKKKEKPKIENVKSLNGEQRAPDTEDVTVPKDIDLIGLPQLCFPGMLTHCIAIFLNYNFYLFVFHSIKNVSACELASDESNCYLTGLPLLCIAVWCKTDLLAIVAAAPAWEGSWKLLHSDQDLPVWVKCTHF